MIYLLQPDERYIDQDIRAFHIGLRLHRYVAYTDDVGGCCLYAKG